MSEQEINTLLMDRFEAMQHPWGRMKAKYLREDKTEFVEMDCLQRIFHQAIFRHRLEQCCVGSVASSIRGGCDFDQTRRRRPNILRPKTGGEMGEGIQDVEV